jgi:prolactin regulatory element-binding protein
MRTQHTLHPLSAFPVYSAGFLSDTRFVLGGGGGTGRSGIRNKLVRQSKDTPRHYHPATK